MVEKLKMIWQDAKQLKDERGLTLVELLVVVVILGIIAAIAVVAIGGIIENSRKDAMVADAKQMVSAAKLHTASNPLAKDATETIFFKGYTEGAGNVDGAQYVNSIKDPFGGQYTAANVAITEADGVYTYKVTLEGSKYKYENATEGQLNKEETNLKEK